MRHDRAAPGPLQLGQLAGDEGVAGADLLVGGQAEADDVDLEQRLADQVVEPLPEQGARLVQPGGVDEDQLRRGRGDDPADGVPGGLRLAGGDGDLVPHQRVGQRRLAGVGPSDEAGEPGPELGVHDASSRCRRPRSGQRPRVAMGVLAWLAVRGVVLGTAGAVQASHDHGGDPVAAAGHPLGGQLQPGDLARRARDRDPADGLAEQAADGVDLLLLDGRRRRARRGRRCASWPAPGRCRPRAARRRAASRSYSSAISPTISSRMSSMVTRPAVPPYSSTTMAKWVWSRCISRSRSSTGLLSGTKCIGPHQLGRRAPSPASGSALTRRATSLK